jgi:hypothetical protein
LRSSGEATPNGCGPGPGTSSRQRPCGSRRPTAMGSSGCPSPAAASWP